jgi:hypothetical protein
MKPYIKAVIALTTLASLSGCYAFLGVENGGLIYRDVTLPLTATEYGPGSKVGRAEATTLLGLISTGNAGIEAAKRNGGITKVAHVDYRRTNMLGIFATYEVIVYGD